MNARILGFVGIAAVVAISVFALACGDDNGAGSSSDASSTADQLDGVGDVAGAIVPDTFLTYDGEQYELKEILQADLVDESEFTEAGEASEINVDGDPTVYTREGDDLSVCTFFEGTGSGEAATPDSWYRWDAADRRATLALLGQQCRDGMKLG